MPLNLNIIITGLMALAVWGCIWRHSLDRPLGWCSPTALFAAGLLVLYVIPSLYWQFRPWPYYLPPYFEGVPLVMLAAFLLGLPFIIYDFLNREPKRPNPSGSAARAGDFTWLLWSLAIPILIGMALRLYLLSTGWQARLARETFTVADSYSLGLIVRNFISYYPCCYFGLAAFGSRTQRLAGRIFWVLDGGLMFWTLHRHELMVYVLHSLIFLRLQGWKPSLRQLTLAGGVVLVFTIAIIGQAPRLMGERLTPHQAYLDPLETLNVVAEAFGAITRSENLYGKWGHLSPTVPVMRALDDTMFRLYEARSAAAVMSNVPGMIPYFYGETFVNILYAFVPRYFWEGKPTLDEIHKVTTWVMPGDMGINPTGTIAEFYMNFGLLGVFLGGIVCLALCRMGENSLGRRLGIRPAFYTVYPVLSLYFIWASETFSRRMAEGLRTILVLGLLSLVFHLAVRRRKPVRIYPQTASCSLPSFLPVMRKQV